MTNQDCYAEVRSMVIERCQDMSKPIIMRTRLAGDARKALKAALRIVGEKSAVIDEVFRDLWRAQLLIVNNGHLVFDKERDDAKRKECRKNHPAAAARAFAATA